MGGTSLSAPCWAGLFVLGGLNGVPSVYAQASTGLLYASNYHDITSGSNGNPAGAGYDLVTGLGSPKANNLVPGPTNQLCYATQPSDNNYAGEAFATQPVVAVLDASGNTVTTSTASVTLSITTGTGTDGATLSGTTTANAVNGIANFSGLSIDKVGSGYTLMATSSGLVNAISTPFTIITKTISKLSVTGYVSPATAGVAGSITVTAQDAAGNTITNYTGTVHFTSSDTQAVLPANYTFVGGDNGTHVFSVTLKTAGSQSITATDTVTGSITGSQSGITVNSNIASQIRVETAANGSGNVVSAQNVTSGNSMTVYAITRDQYGNFVANAVGTWSLVSKTGGIADGDLVAAGDNKSAIFTGHVIGTGVIHVISGSLTYTDSGTLTVVVGTISKLSVTGYVSPATAGVAGSITVTAQDAAGNTITNYTGMVHFTSSDTQAVLPANYTFVGGDNGTHVFSVTLKTAGSQSITATDTMTGSINGSQSSITVNATASNKLVILTSPQTLTADVTSGTITVQRQDQFGNPNAAEVNLIVNLSSNSTGTHVFRDNSDTTNISNVTINQGSSSASFKYKDNKAGTPTITAASGSLTSGTQQETVNSAVASQIRVETAANGSGNVVLAQNVTVGNHITVYAITRDQYGNFVANAVGTWSLINKTGGIADSDLVAAGDNKSAVFTGHIIGTAAVHVTSGSLTYTDSGILTVIAAPPSGGGGGGGGGPIGPITVAGVTNVTLAVNDQGVFNQDVNIWSDDNNVLLHVPTGTTGLTSSGTPLTQISIIHEITPPALPAGASIISLSYDFTPSGVTFNPPAIIRFGYDPTLTPAGVDASSLQIAYYDSTRSAWITLTTTSVDTEHHFIFAQIVHFTSYAVVYGVKAVVPVPTTTPAVITTPVITTTVTTTPTTTTAVTTTPTTTTMVTTTPTTTTTVTITPTTTTTVATSTTPTIPTSPTKQKSGGVSPPIIIIIVVVVAMVISLAVFLMRRKTKK